MKYGAMRPMFDKKLLFDGKKYEERKRHGQGEK
jgi:hypothetical protein